MGVQASLVNDAGLLGVASRASVLPPSYTHIPY